MADLAPYLSWLETRSQPRTVTAYRQSLERLGELLGSGLELATTDELALAMEQLGERYLPATRLLALSALRSYARWAVEIGTWSADRTAGIEPGERPTAVTHQLNPTEARQLLERGLDPTAKTHDRDRAVLLLAVHLGLKTGELERLTWGAVDFEGKQLHVDGGPRRGARHLPLDRALMEALQRLGPASDPASPVLRGSRDPTLPLNDRALRRIVSAAGQRAGLDGVNFDAIRFARVRAELWSRTDPLRVVAGTLGYGTESGVLRGGGRFSKE